jgi:hypothetical protein
VTDAPAARDLDDLWDELIRALTGAAEHRGIAGGVSRLSGLVTVRAGRSRLVVQRDGTSRVRCRIESLPGTDAGAIPPCAIELRPGDDPPYRVNHAPKTAAAAAADLLDTLVAHVDTPQ